MGKISFSVFHKKSKTGADKLAVRLDSIHIRDNVRTAQTGIDGKGEFDKYDIGVNDVYRVVFETGNYWETHNHNGVIPLKEIAVQIEIVDPEAEYNISLSIEPDTYSCSVLLL